MKKVITISLFFVLMSVSGAFSQMIDTTINADINPDRKVEKIEVIFMDEGPYAYILKVDNKEYKGELEFADYAYAELIDIDNSDGYREIAIVEVGSSDSHLTHLFRYTGDIIKLGEISGMSTPETTGDGIASGYWWMGFWGFNKEYKLDNDLNRILEITRETYKMKDVEAEVTKPFSILKDRVEGTDVVATLKPGTKIKFVEVDIKPVCVNSSGYMDDDECDWFRVVTEDGTTGWVQLKDFRENVEGLIWAG